MVAGTMAAIEADPSYCSGFQILVSIAVYNFVSIEFPG
jgi:hypothetical protein